VRSPAAKLINNILMADLGDEGLSLLKTEDWPIERAFQEEIRDPGDGPRTALCAHQDLVQRVHYGIGCYAANQEDLAKGKLKWPANSEFIGVDVYHFWVSSTALRSRRSNVPRRRVAQHAIGWQNVITKYHGPDFRVTMATAGTRGTGTIPTQCSGHRAGRR